MLATNWLQPISHLQLLYIFRFRYQNGIREPFQPHQTALLCGNFEDGDYSHSIQIAIILVSSLDIMRFICTESHILSAFFVLSIFLRSKCGQRMNKLVTKKFIEHRYSISISHTRYVIKYCLSINFFCFKISINLKIFIF